MDRLRTTRTLLLFCSLITWCGCVVLAAPPEVIKPQAPLYTVVRGEHGVILLTKNGDRFEVISTVEQARAWSGDAPNFKVPAGTPPSTQLLLDSSGVLHAFSLKARGDGRKPAVDFFIDLWHSRTEDNGARWSESKPYFEGYVGDVLDFDQLPNGRIVVPFAYWVPGLEDGPPVGSNRTTSVVSDDGGATWSKPVSALTSPCYPDHNGSNNGAVEPGILPLRDGRIWMLMRTQAGFLYQSFSRDGVNWAEAASSRFHSSSGPPSLLRLPDGRIAVFWNNCEMPPREQGQGVYGGRDAIHAAISDDEGRTWQGFREFYRDRRRNETPPHSGDRGTAYPISGSSKDGKMVVLAGQGGSGRNVIFIDPDWLTETHASDDFSNGLDAWSVFKEFGPASGWWRDRCQGPELIDHPTKPGAKVMHVRRPDDKHPDAAVWNFPNGRRGVLSVRLMPREGFGGGNLALTNRFFNPNDVRGDSLAMFSLSLPTDGLLGKKPALRTGTMHTIKLAWDIDRHRCDVRVDGQQVTSLALLNSTDNGVSYLRLASTAAEIDPAGFIVESVDVVIEEARTLPGEPGIDIPPESPSPATHGVRHESP
ncbi:MAG: exo-alpha-sialidase [Candidatus Hydrogenedentes bacterium]|nr:exo-alpha-sialidase [Candidatus Hydrogenedentota bacterium]